MIFTVGWAYAFSLLEGEVYRAVVLSFGASIVLMTILGISEIRSLLREQESVLKCYDAARDVREK